MTVKELKDILDVCNDDASVFVVDSASGSHILEDKHVYYEYVGGGKTEVIIDVTRNENEVTQ